MRLPFLFIVFRTSAISLLFFWQKQQMKCKPGLFSIISSSPIALYPLSPPLVCVKKTISDVLDREGGREKFNEISHSGKEGEVLL